MSVGAAREPQVSLCDDSVPARCRDMTGDKQVLRSIADRQLFERGCEPCHIGSFAVFLLAAREQCAADNTKIWVRCDEEAAQQVVVARVGRSRDGQIVLRHRVIRAFAAEPGVAAAQLGTVALGKALLGPGAECLVVPIEQAGRLRAIHQRRGCACVRDAHTCGGADEGRQRLEQLQHLVAAPALAQRRLEAGRILCTPFAQDKPIQVRPAQKLSKNSQQIECWKYPAQQYVNMGNLNHALA
jgi:hypothetical protein